MPKLYEYLGLIFFFYANEHLPIHVHVSLAEYESKMELKAYHEKIVEKWTAFFVQNKKITCEVINQKLS